MFKGETNDKSNDYEATYAISSRLKKTETQIKTKTKKASKIMTMKRHQMMMKKLRKAELRAKDPEFKMLWLQKQRQLELSTESTPVSPNN